MPWADGIDECFDDVQGERGRLVEELMELARLPAISASGVPLVDAAQRLGAVMSAVGLDARILPTGGSPVVYGERIEAVELPTVLVYGHYDVQPVEPLDEWTTPPFEPRCVDGRIYGRGVSDNKGQHFAQLAAVRAVLRRRGTLPVNVKMIVEGEEEIGSPHLAEFVESHRDLLTADLAYTSDGGIHESGRPLVVCGARGMLYLRLDVHGARADLHSGNYGGIAPNPAAALSRVLSSLWHADGSVAVDGFYDAVRAPTAAERAALAQLPLDERRALERIGLSAKAAGSGTWFERTLLAPNLNIAGMSSGWTGSGTKTIVPASASAKLDARLVPDQDPSEIFAAISAHVERLCPGARVQRLGSMLPSRTPLDHPLVPLIAEAVERGWGAQPYLYPSLPGSIPDYVFTSILGIPSVLVPYANADQANHAPNENMSVECLLNGIQTFIAVLHRLRRG